MVACLGAITGLAFGSPLEAHPERAFWEIRASKTKGLWFKKRPKTLFPDASLEIRPETWIFQPTVGVA
jgi:hypothetical protein